MGSQPRHELSIKRTVDLMKLPDFFDRNPAFGPIKKLVRSTLTAMARRGLTDVSWVPRVRPRGCGGCRQRKFANTAKQLTKYFQGIILDLEKDPQAFELMATRLHGYMEEHKLKPPGADLVFIQITGKQPGRKVGIPCTL